MKFSTLTHLRAAHKWEVVHKIAKTGDCCKTPYQDDATFFPHMKKCLGRARGRSKRVILNLVE